MSDVVSIKVEDHIAMICLDNAPVNALGAPVRTGLVKAALTVAEDTDIRAVVLYGRGRCFSAGADISEFGTEPPEGTPTLPEAISAIEDLTVPVVVAIHGFALGGGLELALGAHYRIATPNAKLGLPEVDLGIIPGAGGTQRLPRLVGVEEAARLVATGAKISGAHALDLGLLDSLTAGHDLADEGKAFAESLIADGRGPRPTKDRTDRNGGFDPTAMEKLHAKIAKSAPGRIAPVRAIESVINASRMNFTDGMVIEREKFLRLRDGPEARALRHLFRVEREAQKVEHLPDGFHPPDISAAGVVGLGTMGQGIALVLARAGIEVIAVELDEARLDAGLDAIRDGLANRVERGRMTTDAMDQELARISGATSIDALADVELVIEVAIEDMAVKKSIFAELDRVCPADTILSSNTSSLDIDEIAAATARPERVAGAHFFAPAQVMKLLEIVRGAATAPETIGILMALAKRIGKIGVQVGNGPGFVGNRMYHRYTWQAYFLLQEGCQPDDVDKAMEDFGFPLGCLAVGDISGLDVAWAVRKAQIASGDIDTQDAYPVIADRVCEMGRFGRKTGKGWYAYEDGKKLPDADVAEVIEDVSAELGITRRAITEDEIQGRCVYALINEGAKLLEKGIARTPGDVDVIWRYGYGFPVWRGGPMHMAAERGLPEILGALERLEEVHGPAFEPAKLIRDRVQAGKMTFED